MGSDEAQARSLFVALGTQNRGRGHRSLVHVAGPAHWCRQIALQAWTVIDGEALWVGEQAPAPVQPLPLRAAGTVLGRDYDLVVFDARAGFDPDAFGAVGGTLRGGALLLLLTPPAAQWPLCPDPQWQRLRAAGAAEAAVVPRYVRRFARQLAELACNPGMLSLCPKRIPPPPPAPGGQLWELATSDDQRRAVRAILRTARGRARRPLVLSADRGRGKSAALGMAAARLAAGGRAMRLLLTAPRRSAVETVYRHAGAALPALTFVPPAELLAHRPAADLLLVDEAAGIPLDVLRRLVVWYPRVVLASTVHGYEGTGRGFALRFREILDQTTPGWRSLDLQTPVRWAADDPLEPALHRLLLLDASRALAAYPPQEAGLELHWCDRDRLAEDERLLREVFALLVEAHYRTRPCDLRNLLDGPALQLLIARRRATVLGVAVLSIEGGFSAELAQRIWRGERRPRGHLLAQALAAHVGLSEGAQARVGRVMRIAVHPQARRQGIGLALLRAVAERGRASGLDLLGASFGAAAPLLGFWGAAGFRTVHLGVRRDPASAAHAALVVQPLSASGEQLVAQALARFRRGLPSWCRDYLQGLEGDVLWAVLAQTAPGPCPEAADWTEAEAFAHGRRGFESSLPALQALCWHRLPGLSRTQREPSVALLSLLLRVVQGLGWQDTARRSGLPGRAAVLHALRAAVAELLAGESAQVSSRSKIRS